MHSLRRTDALFWPFEWEWGTILLTSQRHAPAASDLRVAELRSPAFRAVFVNFPISPRRLWGGANVGVLVEKLWEACGFAGMTAMRRPVCRLRSAE